MQGKKERKRVTHKRANADPYVYDRRNDIFADCPELNRSTDEGNTTTRSQDDFSLLPVTPSLVSASSHSAKKSGDHSIDSEYLLTTPKRTSVTSFKSHVNKSSNRSGSTSKSKKPVNLEKILVQTPRSLSKSSSVSTPKCSEGSYKAILDGYKTLQDIWKRTAISRRSQLLQNVSSAESSPSRNLSLFKTSASLLQCPTTPLANNLNKSETDWKSQNNAGANSRPSTSRIKDEWDEDLPPTQPVSLLILKGVVAFVEVWTGDDNRSFGVKDQLRLLGATVANTFTKHVTHVIFKEGLLSTYKKAIKRKVPLVSVLWIEECKKAGLKVSEQQFTPWDMERYESPNPLNRIKRRKSITPDFEKEFEQRLIKRNKKKYDLEKKKLKQSFILEPVTTDLAAQRERILGPEWVRKVANGNGLVRTLVDVANIGEEEFNEIVNHPPTPEPNGDECGSSSPLAVHLLHQLMLTHKPTTERHANDSLQNVEKDIETVSQKQIDLMELESSGNCNDMSSVVESRKSLDFSDIPSNDSRLHMSVKTNCKPLSINTAI